MSGHDKFDELVDTDPLSLRDIARDLHRFAVWADGYLEQGCRYDHHGYCQSHGLDDKPCPVELMRRTLTTIGDVG